MYHNRLILAIVAIALATLACNLNINLPIREFETGPTVTDEIQVPLSPGGEIAEVELTFGGGELTLSPGAEAALISGTATYNVPELKPEVLVSGNSIRISNDDIEFPNLPDIGGRIENEWNLQIGDVPLELTVTAGAYKGVMELGGLALHDLHITDGAADSQVSFSEPNQAEMRSLRYETGASKVVLTGLGNANFDDMLFQSGAGDYTLDFSGDLQRDASVEIKTGISNLTLIVPEGTAARLTIDAALSNVDTEGNWQTSGGGYSVSGDGPVLTISVDMGAGNLQLRNR